ncbi:hypothetical protein [Thalassospira alkalitolerans]|uniref:hypothetical protein n=1 Tax=Thalassospira alkalitolerans TaxID=1293890 RepID=UPI0030EEC1B6
MIQSVPKKQMAGAIAGFMLLLVASPAVANPAIVLDETICDNQATGFNAIWVAGNVANTRLFFASGTTAVNGAINPVGHGNNFNASDDVYVTIHGGIDKVGEFSGTDFAALFQANHVNPPHNVTMYVCLSGTVPNGGLSSMARIARAYPGVAPNSTLINAVTAPGPNGCTAPRGPAVVNGPLVLAIPQAVIRTDVVESPPHDVIEQRLVDQWAGANNVVFPNTADSFEDFCRQNVQLDPTGQWVPGFLQAMNAQFGVDYLALINTNSAGNDLVTCGAGNGVLCN